MIKVGILGASDIAYRRFMPALATIPELSFIGVAVNSHGERFGNGDCHTAEQQTEIIRNGWHRAQRFVDTYGGKVFSSYGELVSSSEIGAVYIPLPPALHFHWAREALANGKHVIVEKPAVLDASEARSIIEIASAKKLAIHENYMFAFHSQIGVIQEYLESGKIGMPRLYRLAFGFPLRAAGDFRYDSNLGGGAFYDCGGYPIKYASMLLGDTAKILQASMNGLSGYDVDMYGSGVMANANGLNVHFAYGMDNDYRCELDVWGSKGSLYTGRIFTAPVDFASRIEVAWNGRKEFISLPKDDSFKKSLLHFLDCTCKSDVREAEYKDMLRQAKLMDDFRKLAGRLE